MTKYIVQGGKPLFGEVEISGAKNAAVAIIPAALLVDGVCRIENIPQISDVTMSLKILEQLGGVRPTHILLQAGVGAMAGAMAAFFAECWRDEKPVIAVVELSSTTRTMLALL